jgi:uncharacterized membrane protein
MAAIRHSIDINRRPEDVFAYIDDLSRHGEWQGQIESVTVLTEGPTRVGTQAREVRRFGGRSQTQTYEITQHEPPTAFGFKGLDGSIRVVGHGAVEGLDDGSRSRVTINLEFEGHGMGKLMLPMVRGQARKQVPVDQQRLKERLESQPA